MSSPRRLAIVCIDVVRVTDILGTEARHMPDVEAEALILRVLDGDEHAWRLLCQLVEPRLMTTFRRPSFLGRLSDSEDDCRTILANVMARLRESDFARLRTWQQAGGSSERPPFIAWLLVVAKRVAMDHLGAHDEHVDRRGEPRATRPGVWRALDTLIADSRVPGARRHITDDATAHEILARAADLPAPQRDALGAWLNGESYAEIALAHTLDDERGAERAVRAALERLRRQFREDAP